MSTIQQDPRTLRPGDLIDGPSLGAVFGGPRRFVRARVVDSCVEANGKPFEFPSVEVLTGRPGSPGGLAYNFLPCGARVRVLIPV